MSDITSLDDLRALYGQPGERSVKKEMRGLDLHAKAFLAKSPFALIGSSAPDRLPDVSPKGDRPGFAAVLDDRTIAIPDRPGNKRLDTFENVILNPMVGLLFLIPGMDETLRINGHAKITIDQKLLERLAVEGKAPIAALVVTTEEVYLHCAKAFMRSELWNPDHHIDRSSMPTLGAMLRDQIGFSEGEVETQTAMEARYRTTMF